MVTLFFVQRTLKQFSFNRPGAGQLHLQNVCCHFVSSPSLHKNIHSHTAAVASRRQICPNVCLPFARSLATINKTIICCPTSSPPRSNLVAPNSCNKLHNIGKNERVLLESKQKEPAKRKRYCGQPKSFLIVVWGPQMGGAAPPSFSIVVY